MNRYRIVVVEDEGLIALDLKELLEAVGYEVTDVADNAHSAIAAVAAHRPDIVFMDIRIKGDLDGIWAAEEIRRRFDTPIVFVTALADEATIQRARIAGPYGYVVKPFHNVDFRSQIETVVWKHREDRKARMQRAWLESTLRYAMEGLIAVGPEGEVVLINREGERITGYSAQEAIGRPVTEVLPLADERTGMTLLTPLLAVHDGRELSNRVSTYVLRGDRIGMLLVEVNATVQRDDDGLIGLILNFRDITAQRRRADRMLIETRTRGISQVADAFGRELRVHLERLAGLTHSLSLEAEGPASHRERYAHEAHRAATAGLTVVRHLQELGATRHPTLSPVDLGETIRALVEKTAKQAGSKWTWRVQLAEGLSKVLTHQAGCIRHLHHLLREIRTGMPLGGEIRVSSRMGGDIASPLLLLELHAVPQRQSSARLASVTSGYRLELVRHFMMLCEGNFACAISREQDLVFTLGFRMAGTAESAAEEPARRMSRAAGD